MKNSLLLFAIVSVLSTSNNLAMIKRQSFINIPDANFEKYLIDNKIDKDGVVNGKMNVDDARGVKKIDVRLWKFKINSLVGIEVFHELEFLDCSENQLMVLDVSKNLNLKELVCRNNKLTTLNVSKNVKLKSLTCGQNSIQHLDIEAV